MTSSKHPTSNFKITKIFSILFITAVLGACTTATGPLFSELPLEKTKASAYHSRLIVLRPSEGLKGAARSFRVKLDDKEVGSCDVDGFLLIDASEGPHIISADLWDLPGSCAIPFVAETGKTYYFKLSMRTEAIVSRIFMGPLGMAMESWGKLCGGSVQISALGANDAKVLLKELRLSK